MRNGFARNRREEFFEGSRSRILDGRVLPYGQSSLRFLISQTHEKGMYFLLEIQQGLRATFFLLYPLNLFARFIECGDGGGHVAPVGQVHFLQRCIVQLCYVLAYSVQLLGREGEGNCICNGYMAIPCIAYAAICQKGGLIGGACAKAGCLLEMQQYSIRRLGTTFLSSTATCY